MTTSCNATSPPRARTRCGSPTSPSTPPSRASSTAARSRTCFSNRIVGYSVGDRMTAQLAVSALRAAIARRQPRRHRRGSLRPGGAISLPSLPGRAHAARSSPARWAGSPPPATTRRWSRSTRCCRRTSSTVDAWRTRDELGYAIIFWIEHTYNRRRRQRGLGKLTPVEFELAFTPNPKPFTRHDHPQPPSTKVAADPFDDTLPDAVQVADPFHVVKLANSKLDECRRRVQNDTIGHRGRKDDPLYRARRLSTRGHERLDESGESKLLGLLNAGDPGGEVRTAWHAKEVVRSVYDISDASLAGEFVDQLSADLQDESCPPEVNSLGRTITRWRDQIVAWHHAHVSNGPTEAVNNLIKRIKASGSGSGASPTTGSAYCSTPASPTGTYSPPSHPVEIR